MMETAVFVLKVIGIVLALLLAVVLVLLFLALFCRVRYDLAVDAGETITGKARFRWLWFVVRFSVVYDDGDTMWVLRILGIPIKRKKATGTERKEEPEKESGSEKASGKKKKKAAKNKKKAEKNTRSMESEDVKSEDSSLSVAELSEKNLEPQEELREKGESGEKVHGQETVWDRIACKFAKIFAKIRGFLLKIRGIFDTIRNIGKKAAGFIRDLPELLRSMREKKESVVSFLKDKHVRAFLKLSKTQLGCLLVHLKPKKAQGYVRFGTGNPASTGQILGAAAMAYPLYASWLHVVPEFEEKHFSGYLKARGKIQLFRVILIGKRWFLADTSKRCLNKWNKLKEELTNGR